MFKIGGVMLLMVWWRERGYKITLILYDFHFFLGPSISSTRISYIQTHFHFLHHQKPSIFIADHFHSAYIKHHSSSHPHQIHTIIPIPVIHPAIPISVIQTSINASISIVHTYHLIIYYMYSEPMHSPGKQPSSQFHFGSVQLDALLFRYKRSKD